MEDIKELNINMNAESECVELKNIKYKTMMMNGHPLKESVMSNDFAGLDKFLEDEKNTNMVGPWAKLDNTTKSKKFLFFAEKYSLDNNLDPEEKELLILFFKDCIERKKLQKVKEIIYDKTTGEIKDVPYLIYNKQTKHFTLKNNEKRISTLKGLTPIKKTNSTIKHKIA